MGPTGATGASIGQELHFGGLLTSPSPNATFFLGLSPAMRSTADSLLTGLIVNNARTYSTIRAVSSRNLAGLEFIDVSLFMSTDGGFTYVGIGLAPAITAGNHTVAQTIAPVAIPAGAVLCARANCANFTFGITINVSITVS